MEKQKVGVTGGTGFVGEYFLREYASDYEFVAVTSRRSVSRPVAGVRYVPCDYSYEAYLEAFRGCCAVVHLGAKVPEHTRGLEGIAGYQEGNRSTELLLKACGDSGVRKVVLISSSAVYDKQTTPITEDVICRPQTAYGISKVTDELLLQAYARRYGFTGQILRLSQVLGYRTWKHTCFFSLLQDNGYTGAPITVFGDGGATRDIIYVRDAAQGIEKALRSDASGVFNLGMGRGTSNLELARAYGRCFPGGSQVIFQPFTGTEDTQFWWFDISRAHRELGYSPAYDVVAMVEDICRYYEAALREQR